jgi:hypothetical protein
MEICEAIMTFQCGDNPYPGECMIIDIIFVMMSLILGVIVYKTQELSGYGFGPVF